jgi:hypothetical protein
MADSPRFGEFAIKIEADVIAKTVSLASEGSPSSASLIRTRHVSETASGTIQA